MKNCPGLCNARNWTAGWTGNRNAVFRAAVVAVSLFLTGATWKAAAQVVPAGSQEGLTIFAGATGSGQYLYAGAAGSGQYLQFGQRHMLGITGFVDADTRHRLGYTVEGSWIVFHQTNDVYTSTIEGGLRYRFNTGKLAPYAKALGGIGQYNAPYNLATGRFLAFTGGAGIDYNLSRRIRLRMADFEYTYWPQFTPFSAEDVAPLSTMTVSSGIKIRIF